MGPGRVERQDRPLLANGHLESYLLQDNPLHVLKMPMDQTLPLGRSHILSILDGDLVSHRP